VACFAPVFVSLRFARAVAAAGALAMLASIPASADRGGDREVAQRVVNELGKSKASATFAKEPLEKAQHALRRAADARAAGDHVHGAELEALAREWAETGNDLTRAATVEQKLAAVQKEHSETETRLIRARALLEETVARRGRAKTELETLEAERGAPKPPVAPEPQKAPKNEPKKPPAKEPKKP
jgi:colicin import membrane protein